jgi:hypothetical protein
MAVGLAINDGGVGIVYGGALFDRRGCGIRLHGGQFRLVLFQPRHKKQDNGRRNQDGCTKSGHKGSFYGHGFS